MRLDPDPTHVQIALHDLGLDKKSAKSLTSPGADDVEFACQAELPKEEQTKLWSITMGLAGLSAHDAASERVSEKDAIANGGDLEAAKDDRQIPGGRLRCVVQRLPLQPEVKGDGRRL